MPLLESLNNMVSQYPLEGGLVIQQLSPAKTAVWLLTLLLVIEILLIFRPMTEHTRTVITQFGMPSEALAASPKT